jgi:nitrogen fixation protein
MILGALIGVGVVIAVAAAEPRGDVFPPRGAPACPPVAGSELIVVPAALGDRVQVLSVVDPRQRVLCVYHIELATGKITLKSVRKLEWDLQIRDLNNDKPLPEEIRSLVEQK